MYSNKEKTAPPRTSCRNPQLNLPEEPPNGRPIQSLRCELLPSQFLDQLDGVGVGVAVIGKPREEPPQRNQRTVDGGDGLTSFPTKAVLEVGDVPGRHPAGAERLGVGRCKPRRELPQVLHHRTPSVGGEVAMAEVVPD